MRFSGSHFLRRVAGLVLISLLSSPLALCQWDARPQGRLAPLTSGPGTVQLVARLESLSVTAAPEGVSPSYTEGSGADALAITTSWAMRADCTTLRVMTHFGTAFGNAFAADSPDASAESLVQHPGQTVAAGESEPLLMTQPIGASSRPGDRTDDIEVVPDRNGQSTNRQDNPPLDILVQAL